MIKVLRIAGDIYPAIYGGAPIHIHKMSQLQSKSGCEVTVLTCGYDSPKAIIEKHYKVVDHNVWVRIYGNPIAPSIFKSLLKMRNDFDIIHAHGPLFFTSNLAAFVKKLGSPPLVITNHGLISQTAPIWLSNIYYSSLGGFTLRSADKILCYNDVEKQKVAKFGVDPQRIEIIPNGVDTNIFKPIKKVKKYTQILWVGRYKPGKDIETLIKATKLLCNTQDSLRTLLVGQGPLKNRIKTLAKDLGIYNKIIFQDNIRNEKMPDIYNESDIFVLPSIDEGVPRTILEAMACGLPIVCTNLPQITEVVKNCGITVPLRDPQALAEAISRIICDRKLTQRFKENAREKVVRTYSWDETVKKTTELYKTLID